MPDSHVKVAVTGAAGQIGYALLFRIASGQMFGPDTTVDLQLLELEAALPALEGVAMELDDCAFPLLRAHRPHLRAPTRPSPAPTGRCWSGAVPRKAGMERKDLLTINGGIFTGQGRAIARERGGRRARAGGRQPVQHQLPDRRRQRAGDCPPTAGSP